VGCTPVGSAKYLWMLGRYRRETLFRSARLEWLCRTPCNHAGYLGVSTLHTFKINIHFVGFIVDYFNHYRRPLHLTCLSRPCWVSSDTGHHQLDASLRLAHLQGLLGVGPARLLAAMLGDLGVSILRSIKTMTQFSSRFEHQTSHVVCFNARGLLYECVLNALLFSSLFRPVGKPVSHHVVTRPTFSSLLFFRSSYRPSCLPRCSDTTL
jgi:hypothetical protein